MLFFPHTIKKTTEGFSSDCESILRLPYKLNVVQQAPQANPWIMIYFNVPSVCHPAHGTLPSIYTDTHIYIYIVYEQVFTHKFEHE